MTTLPHFAHAVNDEAADILADLPEEVVLALYTQMGADLADLVGDDIPTESEIDAMFAAEGRTNPF